MSPVTASLVNTGPRLLGTTGITVNPLAFGCWRFVAMDPASAHRLIETALDSGMNLIDTADVYGLDWGGRRFGEAEELLGGVLAAAPGLRDRMVLATKGGIRPGIPYDSSPGYLRSAVDASLTRLGVDVIDLYLIHRPDMYTHPASVAETLEGIAAAGKIRAVGVSNHTPAQVSALAHHLDVPIVATQVQCSAAHVDPLRDGSFDQAIELGIVPLAWSPLAGGRLVTGAGMPPDLVSTLDRIADREGVDRAAVAIAFVLAHPAAPVAIVGSQAEDRLAASAMALEVHLDRQDCYDIVQAAEGAPLP
jgi:predicted oxidoreductase